MTKEDVAQLVLAAKAAKGLTWKDLAKTVGRTVPWTTAAS